MNLNMKNMHIEIDVKNPFHTSEFTNPMPLVVVDHLTYFHSTESNKKLTVGEVDVCNRDLSLSEFLNKVGEQLYSVWGDERYDRLTIVLRNIYRVYKLTYYIRYNPTRFKVNGKNVYHGEIYYPDEDFLFKAEDATISGYKASLRQRLAADPEYLRSTIKGYQVLNMEDMLRDLYLEDFNRYCPYIIGYNHTHDENGVSIGEPMFRSEVIKSVEWNEDEEAQIIPDLYLLQTITVADAENGEEVFDYRLHKVDRDFYDHLSTPIKFATTQDEEPMLG